MSEFVVASLRLSQLLRRDKTAWREKTKQAFDKLDTNGDGFLVPDEVMALDEVRSRQRQRSSPGSLGQGQGQGVRVRVGVP